MAERGSSENHMELRGMGRAQLPLQAIEDFRRREEGWGSSSLPVPGGRAGITPRNLSGGLPGNSGMCVSP